MYEYAKVTKAVIVSDFVRNDYYCYYYYYVYLHMGRYSVRQS